MSIHATKGQEKLVIGPTAMTNSATQSASIDTVGADWATIRLGLKIELNTNAVGPTISLLESDDTVVTNHATIVANRVEDLTIGHAVIYQIDLRGRKRFLRLTVTTATATNDDVTVCAFDTLTRLGEAPSNTSDMVATTNDAVVLI